MQVQVRNPAGITTAMPLTVQATAPQLFTADGKYVVGVHANGNAVAKTNPAVPGETITVYATGLGATSPALTPGQLPTSAVSVATAPQVTIGSDAATGVAAAVVPGAAGVYQISFQVPSNAANGDLALIVQSGTASSASTLITVQK